ncbi:biotin--protein ligase [Corynebacterium phocae]|uniref:biotin--[biotin carboxyl-carrier protein] ligase n=1 Tax=Corynebacterium phocae TaxID=161895 RepID=A0A1L7D4P8_9CORY|nr:biotin--[acetyl-CoA-carboxylase] ligase [Corynebacterium phocae]APT93124.1 biotin--protein ligase [Corynebacterium phocae]KAA8722197.1 biotin--[acetyl-CoA-carboxylase] ligase [Corynebacterium phocae]
MTTLDIERIRTELAGLWAQVRYVEETGSTNTDLMQATDVADATVLITNSQTAGKGRLGRSWVAPAGSQVTFSVLILPDSLEHLGTLPLAAGLAIMDSIPGTVLKWPNDVLLGGKKLSGVLAEAGPVGSAFKSPEFKAGELTKTEVTKAEVTKTEVTKAEVTKTELAPKTQAAGSPSARVVVGMGINVTLDAGELPVPTATSLKIAGIDTDRTEVAIAVLRNLRTRFDQWESQDPQLMRDYRQVCSSIGMNVRLEAPGGDIHGTVEGVAEDGRINVGGQYYSAGDVIHLRPAGS